LIRNIKALRDRNNGDITLEVVVDTINKWVVSGNVEGVIYAIVTKDGRVLPGGSGLDTLQVCGASDVIKRDALQDALEE